jgi:hypothetical protein
VIRDHSNPPHKASNPSRKTPKHLTRLTTEDSRHLSPAGAPSQLLSPKQPPTGDNRQIGEHQTKVQARYKAERADPSRYDDDGHLKKGDRRAFFRAA